MVFSKVLGTVVELQVKARKEKKIYKSTCKSKEKKPSRRFHGPYSRDTRPTGWFSKFNEENATKPVVRHLLEKNKTVY